MRRSLLILAVALIVCLAPGDAQGPSLRVRVYATGFQNPVAFVQDPTDRAVQFVVEQSGVIRAVRAGTVLATHFLDITSSVLAGGERGLLGLAFAPDYAASGRFYVNFTNNQGHTVVARFRRSANAAVADPASRFDLRWGGPAGPTFIQQPFANHNGGHLAFGPDGYLYIGLGDGGSGNDPDHRAQEPSDLLGKMLRIDVSVPDNDPVGYRVPAGNPFAGGPVGARPEIWSFGLRNPWRYSFDDPAARRHGGARDRRCRPEPVRGDRLRAGGPRRAQLRVAQSRRGARQRHQPSPRVHAAGRACTRVRSLGGLLGDGRLRVPGARPGRRLPGPLLLRRPRWASVVARPRVRRLVGRGARRRSYRAHRRTGKPRPHLLLRRRRGRRALPRRVTRSVESCESSGRPWRRPRPSACASSGTDTSFRAAAPRARRDRDVD